MKTLAELQLREERLLALIADRASPSGEKAAAVTALAKIQEQLDALGAPRRTGDVPRPEGGARKAKSFPARFSGWCWSCELNYEKGTRIVASGDKRWIHATCAERWQ